MATDELCFESKHQHKFCSILLIDVLNIMITWKLCFNILVIILESIIIGRFWGIDLITIHLGYLILWWMFENDIGWVSLLKSWLFCCDTMWSYDDNLNEMYLILWGWWCPIAFKFLKSTILIEVFLIQCFSTFFKCGTLIGILDIRFIKTERFKLHFD